MVNAVGGAMMRDLLIGWAPRLFRPGRPVAFAALTTSLRFSLLTLQFGMSHEEAAFLTLSTDFALDLILLRFNIRSHPLESFRDYWDDVA